jgi:hypothetical protein
MEAVRKRAELLERGDELGVHADESIGRRSACVLDGSLE